MPDMKQYWAKVRAAQQELEAQFGSSAVPIVMVGLPGASVKLATAELAGKLIAERVARLATEQEISAWEAAQELAGKAEGSFSTRMRGGQGPIKFSFGSAN